MSEKNTESAWFEKVELADNAPKVSPLKDMVFVLSKLEDGLSNLENGKLSDKTVQQFLKWHGGLSHNVFDHIKSYAPDLSELLHSANDMFDDIKKDVEALKKGPENDPNYSIKVRQLLVKITTFLETPIKLSQLK